MGGFIGAFNAKFQKEEIRDKFDYLSGELFHRGPDGYGFFSDGICSISYRRLKITDFSDTGKQPMQNMQGTISIVHNGEVYNFKELKNKYALDKKFRFKSNTDTEVLLYLYEILGIDFVNELNGMFAMAIWDMQKRKLYLIRDRFGVKPLFYLKFSDSLWFASEIKALLKLSEYQRNVCPDAIHHYFSLGYIPGEITAFEGIREVIPACFLEITYDSGIDIEKKKYWKPVYGRRKINDPKKVIAEVRALIEESVRLRLISDVPIGVMLSGGLDSSTLALFMSNILGNSDFHTFSLGFDERSFDETLYAKSVAKYIGTKHHVIKIDPHSIVENIDKYLLHIDEPYADGSAIPTYLLAKEAKKYVKVLLSGEGGDEVFAGYITYLAYFMKHVYGKLPGFIRKVVRNISQCLPVSYSKLSLDFKIKKFVDGAEYNIPISHYKWREIFTEDEKAILLKFEKSQSNQFRASCRLFEDKFFKEDCPDNLNKILAIDCLYHLADDLMVKNDRMTMAHSIETRVPFTDLKLFEYLANFSGMDKVKRLRLKYLLKEAMRFSLPKKVIKKKKVGLEIPYSKWFFSGLKGFLLDNLSHNSLKKIDCIDSVYVQQIISEHFNGIRDRGRELWSLLNFVIWYKLYFIEKAHS